MKLNLLNGCCLDILKTIESDSIDLILADPPYGTTQCKWDSIIPLNDLLKSSGDELSLLKKPTPAACPVECADALP